MAIQTVGFQTNFPAGCPSAAVAYQEAGMTFTNNTGNRWASPFVNRFVGSYGSPSKLIAAPSGGGTFTFISMQVCNANTAIPPQTITFHGTKSNGTVVHQSFVTPGSSTAPQTFSCTDFTNLTGLVVDLGFVAFDNFVFDAPVTRTITFQTNFPAGCPSAAVPYQEAGLTFTNNTGNRWASPFVNNFVGSYGSPSVVTATAASGTSFEFKSLQVCNPNTAIPSQPVVFKGTRADGTTVTASFATPGYSTAPQTFTVSGFTNLVSLEMQLGFVAFDNFVFAG